MSDKITITNRKAFTAAIDEAVAHHSAGRLQEAEAIYRRLLAAEPNNPDALNLLGVIAHQGGKNELAVELIKKAITASSSSPGYHNNLGMAHQGLGEFDLAVAAHRRALELKPGFAAAHNNLGIALGEQGKPDDALAAYRRAVELKPDYAEAHNNLGNALNDQGKPDQAVAAYRRALELKHDYAEAHNNLGNALRDQGKLDDAVVAYHKVLEVSPGFAEAHNNLGNALNDQGKLDDAVVAYGKAVEVNPGFAEAHSNLLYCLHFHPSSDRELIFAMHRKWIAQHAERLAPKAIFHTKRPIVERRIRLGLVSYNFRRHPVGYLALSSLEALYRNAYELYCYADVVQSDDITERFRAATHTWRTINGWRDEHVAASIRDDCIDILVDMSGHGAGSRLLVFARKPAPVQVKWVGCQVNTTGMDAMDYFISDSVESPPEDEQWYTEEIVRLPDGYACYEPPNYAPAVSQLPAVSRSHITFGCFNNTTKINRGVIALWSRLLDRVAGSRLVLKATQFNDAAVRAHYQAMFAEHGIAPSRLDLLGHSPHAELLAHYNDIDIALDPFPFSGCLTTCEALWMGVPVVTMPGQIFAHRHSASFLREVGLTDWVVDTPDQYLRIAERYCSDLDSLAGLRADLRQQVGQSPLCDVPRFARNLEIAFRRMWRKWCETRGKADTLNGAA